MTIDTLNIPRRYEAGFGQKYFFRGTNHTNSDLIHFKFKSLLYEVGVQLQLLLQEEISKWRVSWTKKWKWYCCRVTMGKMCVFHIGTVSLWLFMLMERYNRLNLLKLSGIHAFPQWFQNRREDEEWKYHCCYQHFQWVSLFFFSLWINLSHTSGPDRRFAFKPTNEDENNEELFKNGLKSYNKKESYDTTYPIPHGTITIIHGHGTHIEHSRLQELKEPFQFGVSAVITYRFITESWICIYVLQFYWSCKKRKKYYKI